LLKLLTFLKKRTCLIGGLEHFLFSIILPSD
jgi:hypothetical protein